MATKVVMPPLGDSSDEAKVLRWLKQVGDSVQKGDTLLEIETDKATVEIDAYGTGILRKIIVPEGETVAVGVTLGVIAVADEDISAFG
ncbi:MAG: biotin/lipoyl-containing protein [Chloroflexota bacterium]|nr:biotin/lipoyl-containing protein [Chloroflexota bacterium]